MAATLRELQRWLADVILEPEGHGAHGGIEEARRGVVHTEDAMLAARLDAYVQGYPARLEGALAETFPATRHLLGAAEFRALVGRYRSAVPAGAYDLAAAGRALPAFLVWDAATAALPFLPDLGHLEWAVHEAFHATLAPATGVAAAAPVAAEDWDRAVIEVQPGVAVVESPWPVRDLWHARKTPREEIDVALADRPQSVLVYRSGDRVATELITAAEARALARLLAGSPLGEVIVDCGDEVDTATVGRWTAGWMRRGLVAGIRIDRGTAAPADPRRGR